MRLEPLCEWAKCLSCMTSHRTPVMAAPACCDTPFVLSVCAEVPAGAVQLDVFPPDLQSPRRRTDGARSPIDRSLT